MAHGVYGPAQPGGTYILLDVLNANDDIDIHGGFIAGGSTNPDAPDGSFTQTSISGALSPTDDTAPVVTLEDVSDVTIDGFSIQNGDVDDSDAGGGNGAGMYCWSPQNVRLENITFRFNDASGTDGNGGGLYMAGGFTGFDEECQVTYNAEIDRCTFSSNTANNGAGVYVGATAVKMCNADFHENSAAGFGGGIFLGAESVLQCANALVYECDASEGGGIYIRVDTDADEAQDVHVFRGCTISNNSCDESSDGAGIHVTESGDGDCVSIDVQNSIVYGNVTGFDMFYDGGGLPFTVENSCWGSATSMTIDLSDLDNINSNPLFVNAPAGNYRLQASSPCIDQGDNSLIGLDIVDLDEDGNFSEPLPFDLRLSGRINNVVDMGVFERY